MCFRFPINIPTDQNLLAKKQYFIGKNQQLFKLSLGGVTCMLSRQEMAQSFMIQMSIHQVVSHFQSWLIVMIAVWSALCFVKSQFLSSPRDGKVKWYEQRNPAARAKSNKEQGLKYIKASSALSYCSLDFSYSTSNGKNERWFISWMFIAAANSWKHEMWHAFMNPNAQNIKIGRNCTWIT